MRAPTTIFCTFLTAVLFALLFGCASSPNTPNATEAEMLQRSYSFLLVANHNYNRHRGHAMQEIEAASKLLGAPVKGKEGPGRESRTASDTQLRQAQDMLEQARGMAAAKNQTEVVEHIDTAITELGIALTIR